MFYNKPLGKIFCYLSAIAFLIPFACFGFGRALTTIPFGVAIAFAVLGGDIKGAIHYLKSNKFVIPMVLLPVMMYVGILYTSKDLKESAFQVASQYHWMFFPLLLTPMLIVVFNKRQWQLIAYHLFILGAILVSLIGVLSVYVPPFFKWVSELSSYQGYDASSPLQSHTETGFIAALGVFLVVNLWKFTTNKYLKAIYLVVFLFVSYYILFVNSSKTSMLLYTLLILLFICQSFFKNWKYLILLCTTFIVTLVVVFYFSPQLNNRVKYLFYSVQTVEETASITSFGQRSMMLEFALNEFKQSPIIGHGTGSIIKKDVNKEQSGYTTDPHSEFLFLMTKLGLIGLVLFLLYLGFMFYDSFFVIRKGIEAYIAQGFSIAILYYALVESILYHDPAHYEVAFFVSLLFLSNLKRVR